MNKQTDIAGHLRKPILTERFELRPINRWRMAQLTWKIHQDDELRHMLTHRQKPSSFLKILLKTRRSKIPKRLYHEIIDRQTRAVIGQHYIGIIPHNTATMMIAIIDKNWWGKGAVLEIRKSLIPIFHSKTDVTQFCSDVYSRNFPSILNYGKLKFENTGVRYSAAFDEVAQEPVDYLSFSLRGQRLADSLKEWANEPN